MTLAIETPPAGAVCCKRRRGYTTTGRFRALDNVIHDSIFMQLPAAAFRATPDAHVSAAAHEHSDLYRDLELRFLTGLTEVPQLLSLESTMLDMDMLLASWQLPLTPARQTKPFPYSPALYIPPAPQEPRMTTTQSTSAPKIRVSHNLAHVAVATGVPVVMQLACLTLDMDNPGNPVAPHPTPVLTVPPIVTKAKRVRKAAVAS